MKLRFIEIKDSPIRPLLNEKSIQFINFPDESISPKCFIGVNGSGKSQILEAVAEIFLYLDNKFRKVNPDLKDNPPCLFLLEYFIYEDKKEILVRVQQETYKSEPIFQKILNTEDEESTEVINKIDVYKYLPKRIIGYSSGNNETLSLPFLDYYDVYAKYTRERALPEKVKSKKDDYDPKLYFMDYNTNTGVVISNFTLGNENDLEHITKEIGLKLIRNFQITIQTKHQAARIGKEKEISLTKDHEKWIEQLKKSATCYQYYPDEKKYILDFYNNNATKKALKHFFESSKNLYTAIYKIELLNSLIIKADHLKEIKKSIKERRVLLKYPTVPEKDKVLSFSEIKLKLPTGALIDYLQLSDGEHQLFNVFGTILMFDEPNILFLLDEPETHFNPLWRKEFIQLLMKITKNRHQEFLITSHSPFIVSDCKKENVFIFKKENNKLKIESPENETYGSNFDYILQIAFDMETSVSNKSHKELLDLIKSKDLKELIRKSTEFGESPDKFFLLKRISDLKKGK